MTHPMTREQMETELAELRAKNEAATSWGAAVGARSERIRGIERALRSGDGPSQTAVERFQARVVEMIDKGCHGFHFTPGEKWHGMPIEAKCAAILEMWDSRRPVPPAKSLTKEESDLMWKALFASGDVVETLTESARGASSSGGFSHDPATHISENVFDGIRPLTTEQAEQRRQSYHRTIGPPGAHPEWPYEGSEMRKPAGKS